MYRLIDTHEHGAVGSIDFLRDDDGQVLLGLCIFHDFDVIPNDMKGVRAVLCTADCLAYIFGNIQTDNRDGWMIFKTWESHEDYYKWVNRNTLTD